MVLAELLDPVLRPLLALGDFWAMVVLTFLLSLIITLVYKYVTDQVMMKQLKEDIKKLQQKSKEHKGDSAKMMAVQKEMMDKNMVLMRHSFKPTLITFLPLILIMGWMQANLAFEPIRPGQEFTVTIQTDPGFSLPIALLETPGVTVLGESNITQKNGIAMFTLSGEEGVHNLDFKAGTHTFAIEVPVTTGHTYGQQMRALKEGDIKKISVSYAKRIFLDLGFMKLGWIGTYIIFSLIFSIGLRKLMKVY